MPTGDFPDPEGMVWTDACGWVTAMPGTKLTLGHNNPPGMIDTAGETASAINSWLTDHPVIETEEAAREAKVMIDRGKLGLKDLDDERDKQVRPLRMEIERIREPYRQPESLLKKITEELLRRARDYLAKEEAKRIKIAEEARKAAAEAERLARDAEQRERDTVADAEVGAIVDVEMAIHSADEAYSEYQRSERAAKLAERESKVKIGGGFTRSLSLRSKETLTVKDAISAINAIGMTPDIEAAILKGARAYRQLHNELPPGIESKTERSA